MTSAARGWAIALVAAVLAVFVGTQFFGPASSQAKVARDACRAWATARLVSPGSVQFLADSEIVSLGDTSGMISGKLDSQNGFGALLRSKYLCFMTRSSATDPWHVTKEGGVLYRDTGS